MRNFRERSLQARRFLVCNVRLVVLLVGAAGFAGAVSAEEPETPPVAEGDREQVVEREAVRPPTRSALPQRPRVEQEWLRARRRLETELRPGELRFGSIRFAIEDLYELNAEEREKIYGLLAEYDKQLAARAAKWLEELRAVRDAYEKKVIGVLPGDKHKQAGDIMRLAGDAQTAADERQEAHARETSALAADIQTEKDPAQVKVMRERLRQMREKFSAEAQQPALDALRTLQTKILDKEQLKLLMQRLPLEWLRPKAERGARPATEQAGESAKAEVEKDRP